VLENRVLKRVFGPNRDEVTVSWRKLHNGKLHNLYFFAKYRSIRWAGHVTRMGRKGMHIGYLWESQKERDH
jgi:hypothetical protein